MYKFILTSIINLLFVSSIIGQQNTFKNPVIKGDMPDPSIIRIDDTYYATGTSSEWAPHYPMYTSKDLINWTQTGYVFNKKPEWTSNSFWAPELYHHSNGKVYCYYTARRASDGISYIGVATADSPTDEFTDHGLLIEYGTEAIDAFIYDDNGQLYISWKAYGLDSRPIELVASKLSKDGLSLEGNVFSLLKDDENIGMEGQYHFKNGDYYYIVYAAHGCCGPHSNYDVYVARSKKFRGPYEKFNGNPILHGGEGDFLSSGHGTAVETPDGRMFFMCHGYLKGEGFYAGRQPILQEMYVADDNWVQFKTGNITKIEQPMPFSGTVQKGVTDFEDNFNEPELKLDWIWNYPYADADIKVGDGKLILSGKPKTGTDQYNGTALCLRSQAPDYTYEVSVSNNNQSLKGLTMYGDDKNYITLGVINNSIELGVVRDGKNEDGWEIASIPPKTPSSHLKIQVEKGHILTFYRSDDGKEWIKIIEKSIESSFLVRWDRVARPGLIHIGKSSQPAEFSHFKLTYK
ncbi:MAG: family 43 glycosylhydrolase [Prevotella sp.]|nr:family 43 glycosylhydrolase [Prevotella sp.]